MCTIESVSEWKELDKDKYVYKVVRSTDDPTTFVSHYYPYDRNTQYKLGLNDYIKGSLTTYRLNEEVKDKKHYEHIGYFTFMSLKAIRKYSPWRSDIVLRAKVYAGTKVRKTRSKEGYNILLVKSLTPIKIIEA